MGKGGGARAVVNCDPSIRALDSVLLAGDETATGAAALVAGLLESTAKTGKLEGWVQDCHDTCVGADP